MKPSFILCAISVIMLFSCSGLKNEDTEKLDNAIVNSTDSLFRSLEVPETVPEMPSWFLGRWIYKGKNETILELWEKKNDSLYTGTSYLTVSKGTVVQEELQLVFSNWNIDYIALPLLINPDSVPVTFALTEFSDSCYVFENPAHDFPQKITYTRISKDSIKAVISGITEGREDSVVFPMAREAKGKK